MHFIFRKWSQFACCFVYFKGIISNFFYQDGELQLETNSNRTFWMLLNVEFYHWLFRILTQKTIGPIYQFSVSLSSRKRYWYRTLKRHIGPCLIRLHCMSKMITICMYILIRKANEMLRQSTVSKCTWSHFNLKTAFKISLKYNYHFPINKTYCQPQRPHFA